MRAEKRPKRAVLKMRGFLKRIITLLSGKVDKLPQTGQWLKACKIPDDDAGTTYIVPRDWTTTSCANFMVRLGAGNMYFQRVQFVYPNTASGTEPNPSNREERATAGRAQELVPTGFPDRPSCTDGG